MCVTICERFVPKEERIAGYAGQAIGERMYLQSLQTTNNQKGHRRMIRFIFLASFVILFLVFSIPLLIVEWIIGKFNMDLKNRSSLAIVNWAFRGCLWLTGVSLTVIGEENVPKDTAVLYVGNHRSYFDILLTYTRVPRPTGYIAKKEMLRYPLLVNWMKNLHCLFLNRTDVKEGLKTILEAIDKVKSGISICIFPEGTRNKFPTPSSPSMKEVLRLPKSQAALLSPCASTIRPEFSKTIFRKSKKPM